MMTQENLLARYTILQELGRGATGAVYAARDQETNAVVALKTLDPALCKSDAGLAERFLKHARSARLLDHRNIVKIHDAGEIAGTACIVMEMLDGESLRRILDRGPLAIARAIRITRDIAGGLAHAQAQGVVHAGLKPSNIILRSGVVKITDFGIGQLAQAPHPYLSPEQARGEAADHRSDIFSLGALFYEMLTQRPPFEGDSPSQLVQNILHVEPALPSTLNSHVPYALDSIVLRMLDQRPGDRMAGVAALLRELQRLEEALGLEPGASIEDSRQREPTTDREEFDYHQAMAVMERESRPKRSSRPRTSLVPAFVVGLAVIGAGAVSVMYYSSQRDARAPAPLPLATATKEAATAPDVPKAPPARVAAAPKPVTRVSEPPPLAAPAPAPEPVRVAHPVAKILEPVAKAPERASSTARLVLAVSPRGEIYVDGEHHGATPPLTTLDLEPGLHRIEVRSGSRKPYLTYMTVQAGDERRIRHDFNAKRMRPPG